MAHEMLWEVSEKIEIQPCHGHDAEHINESTETWDCFEECMGVYDDFCWLVQSSLDDYDVDCFANFLFFSDSSNTHIQFPLYAKNDPPPPSLVWYGCIGKNVEKLE